MFDQHEGGVEFAGGETRSLNFPEQELRSVGAVGIDVVDREVEWDETVYSRFGHLAAAGEDLLTLRLAYVHQQATAELAELIL
jgi:hypothetical protein